AGPPDQIDAVLAAVTQQGRFARRVNMEVASHSALMDPILPELRGALAGLTPTTPVTPVISTVTDPATTPVFDADYWVANVRQPVRLSQAISVAAQDHSTFVEISAHPMLTHAISETLGETHHHAVGTLYRDTDDTVTFHTNLNATHAAYPPDTPHPSEPHPVLPSTPWQHTRHWINIAPSRGRGEPGRAAAAGGVIPAHWYSELTWPARELPAAQHAAGGSWLVLGDPDIGAEIARAVGNDRCAVLADDTAGAQLAAALHDAGQVLYAPEVSWAGWDAEPGYRLFNTARRLVGAMADSGARLWLLTRNAQPLDTGDRANPAHAVLWGLGRTLALEHPEIWGGVIDVDESVPASLAAGYLLAEAHDGDDEDQIVYRAGTRHVPRLQPRVPPSTPAEHDQHGCQLVIGATGHLGPQLIEHLADMGAGTIVAVARHPGSRLDEMTQRLAEKDTTLLTVAADAADAAAMTALFDRFGADLPPLGGVYLVAYGGGPVTLGEMADDDVAAMFAPKLDAVCLLHKLSLPHPIRHFVMFTSISGVLGSRWLGHYAATTTYLDSFAYARRAAGLPATAINWGWWQSLADSQSDQHRHVTQESGLQPMPDEVAIQVLRTAIGPHAPTRSTIAAADWARLADAYRTRTPLHIIDDLQPAGDTDDTESDTAGTVFRQALRDSEPDQRRALLTEQVVAQVVAAMGLASAQLLDRSAGFFQSGMDSLMSVTLQRALADVLGVALPASVVFDYPSVEALTDHLATVLPEFGDGAAQPTANGYDELTEDELLQQLSERVA
ncbi:type I polyketide synthase, partial [Mycobacterium talmoniae]|uniref:type I polyketide synthase n=1 Tax=Mycobacterium talmoniae TaxID=1858794 RepID=UPI000AB76EC0